MQLRFSRINLNKHSFKVRIIEIKERSTKYQEDELKASISPDPLRGCSSKVFLERLQSILSSFSLIFRFCFYC